MKILAHICCGPCSITSVRAMLAEGHQVTGLFYNPNIHPLKEYLRRREGAAQVAGKLGIPVIFKDDEYDPKTYFRAVAFREASRCLACYALRLERTQAVARRGRFDCFTTTLLYSKFQKHEEIRTLGRDMAGSAGPEFYYEDFRSGWAEGIALSKKWDIYRQQYCGCLYSEMERYASELRALTGPA